MSTRLIVLLRCALIVGPIAMVDWAVVAYWHEAAEQLGGLLRFELGLVIFLNALTVFFTIDCAEEIVRLPGLGWFYDLPITRGRCGRLRLGVGSALEPRGLTLQRVLVLLSRTLLLAFAFFVLEVTLFPFIPAKVELQFESILVVVGLLVHLILSKLRVVLYVISSPRSP